MKKKSKNKNKDNNDENVYTYKVILIGDSLVGKTSLILRFCKDLYTDNFISTIGIDTQKKYIKKDGKKIELQIWDTAGQEKFHSLSKNSCNQMDGIILVFDLGNKETFKNIKNWYSNLEDIVDFKKTGVILVGNKCDINKYDITKEKIEDYCKQKHMEYLFSSSKKNINVNDIFIKLLDDIMNKNKDDKNINKKVTKLGKLSIAEEEELNEKKKKCC